MWLGVRGRVWKPALSLADFWLRCAGEMLRQQLLSTVSCYSQFFLSSQGMQGWNTQRRERGKNSQKMTLKALFLCQILLRTHTINTFFCWFCALYFERASVFVLDFPAFAVTKSRAFMHVDSCTHKYPYAAFHPSALLFSAIVWSHNPAAPSVAIITDNINLNSPSSLAPLSASFSCPPLLYLASLSFIPVAPLPFCHYPTQSHKKRRKIQG